MDEWVVRCYLKRACEHVRVECMRRLGYKQKTFICPGYEVCISIKNRSPVHQTKESIIIKSQKHRAPQKPQREKAWLTSTWCTPPLCSVIGVIVAVDVVVVVVYWFISFHTCVCFVLCAPYARDCFMVLRRQRRYSHVLWRFYTTASIVLHMYTKRHTRNYGVCGLQYHFGRLASLCARAQLSVKVHSLRRQQRRIPKGQLS